MRFVYLVAATGWTAIVGLAWWLAEARIPQCSVGYGMTGEASTNSCIIRATATRDDILVLGLTVALVAVVAGMIHAARNGRAWRAAKKTNQAASRPKPKSISDAAPGRSTNAS